MASITRTMAAQSICSRAFHASRLRLDRVAPPHPISHIRPILYDDSPAPSPPTYLRHPYSLSEFTSESGHSVGDYELQYRLLRGQLDVLHQSFWLDSNTRFSAAGEAVLSSLPATSTARDREQALSTFYKQWINQEKVRTDDYTKEWRKRNVELMKLAARVEFQKLLASVSNVLHRTRNH